MLAYEGLFDDYYAEQFCALAVCANESRCDIPLWAPPGGRAVNLTAWSIAGNFTMQDGYEPLYLAAEDGGRSLSGLWMRGAMSGEFLVFSSLQAPSPPTDRDTGAAAPQGTALLNAAILARRVEP